MGAQVAVRISFERIPYSALTKFQKDSVEGEHARLMSLQATHKEDAA